jgi:hypothetical protein
VEPFDDTKPFGQKGNRGPRLLIGGLILFALLAVVSLASRSGFGHSSEAGPSTDYLSYAYTAFLVLWLLAIPVTLWAMWVQSTQIVTERPGFKRVVIQNFLTLIVLGIVIAGALYIKHHGHWHSPDTSAVTKTAKAVKGKKGEKVVPVEPTFKWSVALGIGAIVLVASVPLTRAYLRERQRRRERAARTPLSQREQLAAEFTLVIEDLIEEPDPRRAIVAAYARMEKVFAREGLKRRASETSGEYLHRIVTDLTSRSQAVERLTTLFEEAKFGRGEITTGQKDEAIAALREIRADLETTP